MTRDANGIGRIHFLQYILHFCRYCYSQGSKLPTFFCDRISLTSSTISKTYYRNWLPYRFQRFTAADVENCTTVEKKRPPAEMFRAQGLFSSHILQFSFFWYSRFENVFYRGSLLLYRTAGVCRHAWQTHQSETRDAVLSFLWKEQSAHKN